MPGCSEPHVRVEGEPKLPGPSTRGHIVGFVHDPSGKNYVCARGVSLPSTNSISVMVWASVLEFECSQTIALEMEKNWSDIQQVPTAERGSVSAGKRQISRNTARFVVSPRHRYLENW